MKEKQVKDTHFLEGYAMRLAARVKLLLSVGFLLALSPLAHGQAVYGSIFGTVTDPTGAVVPNATVIVTDVSKGTSSNEVSNGSGEFTADHLIPDIYDEIGRAHV